MKPGRIQALLILALDTFAVAQTACDNTSTYIDGHPFPSLLDATTEDLIAGLEYGLFTSVDLVNAYIARINEVNSTLRPVTQLNPDALDIAKSLDDERTNGTTRGPLHGIPVLIKNNIATLDSMNNTAGSYALVNAKVPRDSFLAAKLRQAGAVILGKSNLSQWANYRSLNSSNGWSALGGQVIGPYFPDQDPSGSSSGSGVASALALAHFSLGSETDGSIIGPSGANNVVGIKPSVGLTSRNLVIPISQHQDTVGPIARTVKDAAYLLSAIAGYDPADNYTSAIPFPHYTIPDYVAACNFSALRGKRLGIPRNVFDTNVTRQSAQSPIISTFNEYVLPLLHSAGATIVDNLTWPGWDLEPPQRTSIVLDGDFISDLPGLYLSKLTFNPQNITSVATLRNFTQTFPLEDWPSRDTGIWDAALDVYGGQNNTSPEWWGNYTLGLELAGPLGLLGSLQNDSLDAVIMPTYWASHFPAILGTPVVTVPMGSYPADANVTQNPRGNMNATGPGVPFGLSFLGPKWSEELLVGLAYAFEQRSGVRDMVRPLQENVPTTEVVDVVEGKGTGRKEELRLRRWGMEWA